MARPAMCASQGRLLPQRHALASREDGPLASGAAGDGRTARGGGNSFRAEASLAAGATAAPGAEANSTALNGAAAAVSAPEWLRTALQPALLPDGDAAITDEAMLDRGIISAGAGARTRLLLRKLAAGKEVRIGSMRPGLS